MSKNKDQKCLNGGHRDKSGQMCICHNGFIGYKCEIQTLENLNVCSPSPCTINGVNDWLLI